MIVDDPETLREVNAVFDRYEQALVSNDVAALDALFWHDARTVRYGAGENLVGIEAIREFRRQRPGQGLQREIIGRHVTSFGDDFAFTHVEFRRAGEARTGRQSQTWVRRPEGWRVVAAHVSWMER